MANDPIPTTAHDPGGRSKPRWPEGSVVKARFSDCGCYRWELSESWNSARPLVMWLLMNPSVAGVEHSDPTLLKTGRYARAWGYGGQLIGNVHAYRATDSQRLLTVGDPVGPENDGYLFDMAARSEIVVLAYGQPPKPLRPRGEQVVRMLRDLGVALTYLELSLDGTPKHPRFLSGNLRPAPY